MRGWIASGPQRTPPPDAWKLDPQGIHNRARDLLLNLEHVGEVPFIFLSPKLAAVVDVDELDVNAHNIMIPTEAPLKHRVHLQRAADFADVMRFALKGEATRARHNLETAHPRQSCDESSVIPSARHSSSSEPPQTSGSTATLPSKVVVATSSLGTNSGL